MSTLAPDPSETNPATQQLPALTIGKARQKYLAQGEKALNTSFRSLLNKMIESGIETEFDNDSYLDALYLTDVMFQRSNQSIDFLTGAKADGFLSVLSSSFEKALERIQKNKGKVRVIVLSEQASECLKNWAVTFKDTLQVINATASEPICHFIVCDSKMSRYEAIHGDLTEETLASSIKAKVSFNSPSKAKVLNDLFNVIWSKLTAK